jgi:hypothetical protein
MMTSLAPRLSLDDIRDMLGRQQKKLRRLQKERRKLARALDFLDGEIAKISGNPGRAVSPGNGRRIRRPGVDFQWIVKALKTGPATLKHLQGIAEVQGLSALSVMKTVNENKSKLKASAGSKEPGVRGRAPLVWSGR